jgi:peptidoglycan/xylan/chitin deacetylase (PgdA/CDA1 family)
LYIDDAAHANAAPRTTDDMIARHLSPALTCAGFAAATVHALPALSVHVAPVARALGVRRDLDDPRGVALTFDDGPHPQGTPAVLHALDDAGAVATFFLVGEQVERDPGLAAEIAAAGHEIALHCRRHRNLLRLTPAQLRDDLLRAEDTIVLATGRVPALYRPPYGVLTAAALVLARRRGWEPVLWSRWGRDWRARATATSVTTEAAAGLRGGEIVLLHDADHYGAAGCWRATAGALPGILDRIQGAGRTPVQASFSASRGT